MNAEQVTALYRRFYLLLPRRWREEHESEFLGILQKTVSAGDSGPMTVLWDLLMLALVLRLRRLRDGLGNAVRRLMAVRPTASAAGVLALAVLLSVCVLRWGGQVSIEFVVTSTLVVLLPGIGVIYTVSAAIAGGRASGIMAATGCTLGIVPHIVVAFLGLSGIMQLGASVFEVVRWAGVAYLAWMGVAMLRQPGGPQVSEHEATAGTPADRPAGKLIRQGILVNTLNPKLTLFFFAFLPQFLTNGGTSAGAPVIDPGLIGLSSLFMLLTLACFVLYALAGSALRGWVHHSPATMNIVHRTVGVMLLGFATRLAVVDR